MELLKLLQTKIPKNIVLKNIDVFSYNFHWNVGALKISVFSLTTSIGMLELSDAVFTSSFKISFSIWFWSTSIKLKLPLSLHLFWIAIMLGFLDSSLQYCFQGGIISITYQWFVVWISWDINFCTIHIYYYILLYVSYFQLNKF